MSTGMFSLFGMLVCLWHLAGAVHASLAITTSEPQRALQNEALGFVRQLDEVALGQHHRFHRAIDGLHSHRMRRSVDTDFRHGFYPGTVVGNREDFVIDSAQQLQTTFPVASNVLEWGHIKVKDDIIVGAHYSPLLLIYSMVVQDSGDIEFYMHDFESDVVAFTFFTRPSWQAGHIIETNHYLTAVDENKVLTNYKLEGRNVTRQDSINLAPLSVLDLEHFAFDTITYLGMLTNNGFARVYRWSSRFCRFSVAQDIPVPTPASNLQAFDISGRHYLLVTAPQENSIIFKFNGQQNSFQFHQLLFPDGAKHATYFSDAYEHYLVFIDASGLKSTFYKWNGIEFSEFQVVDTVGASHWHSVSVPGTQDGALLILSSSGSAPGTRPLSLFKHDPITDSFVALNDTAVLDKLNPPEYYNATSTMSFAIGTVVYLFAGTVKNTSDPLAIFNITFTNVVTEDPVIVESQELEAKLEELVDRVLKLNVSLTQASENISDFVTKDGHESIQGHKTFTQAEAREARVEQIIVEDAYIHAPRPTGNESLSHLVNQSLAQREQIVDFLDLLSDAVTLNTTQTITGPKNVWNVTIEGDLNATAFSTRLFDGVDIDELNREAFRLNPPNQVIDGDLTFTRDLTSTASIGLDEGYQVNGIDLSEDAVLTVGAQAINGEKTLHQDAVIQNDMVLASGIQLNGIDPSEQLVTLTGSHVITGQLNFTDVIHINGDIVTEGLVDRVDVSKLCGEMLTESTNQTVLGPLVFQETPVFDTNVEYGGLLRTVNITKLDQAVRINRDAEITGLKSFEGSLTVSGEVIVNGLVNEVDLQQDVVQLAVGGTMSGPREFRGPVEVAGVLNVAGEVNGLRLPQDIVTLKGNHTVRGLKNFQDGIVAAQDINVTGTVDTVDLSEWANDVMTLSTDQNVQGPIVFTEDTYMDSNLTTGLINGIDLQALYEDTFFKTSDQVQVISGNKTFTKPVNVASGHIAIEGLINGYNITEDFLNKFSDQQMTAHKTFVDGFSADAGLNVSGLVADIDLLELYHNSLIAGQEAHLFGKRTFLGNVTVYGIVNVTGTVDGVKLSTDVLTVHGNQTVTGVKTFQRVEVGSASCENVNAALSVNGKNWTDFVLNRVDLTSDQSISANHNFHANVTANNVEIKWLVNGVNLTALLADILTKYTVQTVTGDKTIPDRIIVHGNVSLGDHINGVLLLEFAERVLLLDGPPQSVTGRKIFIYPTTLAEHLHLTGLLDGVDIDFFMSDILYPDNLKKILGTKTFLNGFHAQEDVDVTGEVDGVDLSDDVMTTNTAQNLSGDYSVTHIIVTDPDMVVTGLINGINLVYLNNSILKEDEDQTVNSSLVFVENVTSTTDVTVTGFVDTVDLSELVLRALELSAPLNISENLTTFTDVTFEGPVVLEGLYNGKNLTEWYRDLVFIDTDQVVLGNKTFTGNISTEFVSVLGDMEVDTVLGTVFDDFVDDAVSLTDNITITGEKLFSGPVSVNSDVTVAKTVDGIYTKDIITKDGDDLVVGLKEFQKGIQVNGHINVTELVNGIDISELSRQTLRVGTVPNITADKEFLEDVNVTGNVIVDGLVDGVDLDKDAVTLHTDQTLTGSISFNSGLTVNGNMTVAGLVSAVNITKLAAERATLRDPNAIHGRLTFQGHVTYLINVTVQYLVDGVDLPDLWDRRNELLRWVRIDTGNLLLISEDQCQAVEHLQRVYANAVESLSHISELQEIPIELQQFNAFQMDDVSHLALAVPSDSATTSRCSDSYVYQWDRDENQFVEKATFATNEARSWHAFESRDTYYLAVANRGANPCYGDASVSNVIYSYNGSQFVEHQRLESHETSEIISWNIGRTLYLVVVNSKSTAYSILYRQERDGQFQAVQNFTFGGATAAEFISTRNTTFLIFAADSPTQSPIYVFNQSSGEFDLHQYISTSYAMAVDCFFYKDTLGLVFANYAELYGNKISYDVPIDVWYLSPTSGEFELTDIIDFTAAVDVNMFLIGVDLYLAAVSEYDQLRIFKYEGVVGFSPMLTLDSYGIVSVEVFQVDELPSNSNLLLALAVNPFSGEAVSSRIFQENVVGEVLPFRKLPCNIKVKEIFHGNRHLLDKQQVPI